MCTKTLLFPVLSYTESLSKCGLERLDVCRDVMTQSMFRQIKDPKHPLQYLLSPVKCLQKVLRPTYPYQIPLAKTYLIEGTLYHIAFPRSFSAVA